MDYFPSVTGQLDLVVTLESSGDCEALCHHQRHRCDRDPCWSGYVDSDLYSEEEGA